MSQSPALDLLDRLRARLGWPVVVANTIAQIGIIVTGGAVRLTGSGLGCSTWPECEPGSFTPQFHRAMSINPLIEFGNRTLTGVLLVIAVLVALLVGTDRSRPRSFRWLAAAPLLGVLAQAVIGGITVLFHLNPAIVAVHLLISMTLVALSTWLMFRYREGDGPTTSLVDPTTRTLVRVLVALTVVVLTLGVVVTGAGPHSGDENVGYRFAVDPWLMAKVHAASVWAFLAVLAVVVVRLRRAGARGRLWTSAVLLVVVTLAQGVIGYVQLYTGLPIWLVNLHMLGAALLTAGVSSFLFATRTRGTVDAPALAVSRATEGV
ncbi:COX15/CtaA family protein [Cellulomonas rhizosphaerae]|uniref:Cytochrome oxidase assembly protein n=1 Tax=Cellulomonas rhizosphaerae TaxID=2293719 RepID=A0A413RL45_9CELL|nr:COX15/CtaA family protein [Cellulomonas rhizosphaerae]RHA40488.1 cytochrome oxidase assembly protein [Cellulomonas rhizosphaerae]